MKTISKMCIGLMMLSLANVIHAADDTIYLEETVISGNQELPKVLYILPWREMTAEFLPLRTLNYQESSVMVPVYPAEYRRELAYREQLNQLNQRQQLKTTKGE
jgi:hypothetical protein